ncbi:hypothetical protein DFH09DRAFT_1105264 [Mycena vulgaris]|nr:hypothetical protein DFH09DRAFT_1105264 [Mycena vulgaris]
MSRKDSNRAAATTGTLKIPSIASATGAQFRRRPSRGGGPRTRRTFRGRSGYAKLMLSLHLRRIFSVDALLGEMQARVADLEHQVGGFKALQINEEILLLRWAALATAMEDPDIRTLWHDGPKTTSDAKKRDLFGVWKRSEEPAHITNLYHLLHAERSLIDPGYLILTAEGWKLPPVPAKYFFELGKELAIPTELQVEMATAQKPTGGSSFV